MAVEIIAASHALAERPDEAQRAICSLHQLDRARRISNHLDWIRLRQHEDLVTPAAGLRKGGPHE